MALKRRIVLNDAEISSGVPETPVVDVPLDSTDITSAASVAASLNAAIQKGAIGDESETWKFHTLPWKVPALPAVDTKELNKAIQTHPELNQFSDYNDFFQLCEIGARGEVKCMFCGSSAGHDTDIAEQLVRCRSCGGVSTFIRFQRDHK